MSRLRGRWAPTPSGRLHVGNARTALVTWLSVRRHDGELVWRLEDLDGPRSVPGAAEEAMEDLRWLGLDWDEGPELGGDYGPYVQSERHGLYEEALERLARSGRLFPCRLSRKDLENLATAPHGDDHPSPYPASLRPKGLPEDWFDTLPPPPEGDAALRFLVEDVAITFYDLVYDRQVQWVAWDVGDFVVRRRDGIYGYQLAVVVDDLAMGINEVVRGRDLLDSTPRQIQLIEALGGQPPKYGHLPLVLNHRGEKLSKRDRGLTLASLRESGVDPKALVGALAHSLGLAETPEPIAPADLLPRFAWWRITRKDWRLPPDFSMELQRFS